MNNEKYGVSSIDEYLTLTSVANGSLMAMYQDIVICDWVTVKRCELELLELLGGIEYTYGVDDAFFAFYFDHLDTERLFIELLEISDKTA